MYISSASDTWEGRLCFLTCRKKKIKLRVLVHKPLPESAIPIPISFVYVSGIKFAQAKALVNFPVLLFARNKDRCDFLFLCGWTFTVHLGSCTLYFSY